MTNEKVGTMPVVPAGYQTDEQLFATRYKQGGRTVYGLALSPEQITAIMKRPDPTETSEGNRKITESHAKGFARYFIENDNWVIPGIILRAPSMFKFDSMVDSTGGVDFGILSFAKRKIGDIHILDGQHRTLGFFAAIDMIDEKLEKLRHARARARRVHDDNAVASVEREIAELERVRHRAGTERMSVEIQIVEDLDSARQMFFDIADNALGITASTKARFDTRQAVNRALPAVLTHPFLFNRVEMNLDRVQRSSPNILSARQVAEVIRVLAVGFDGRISKYLNASLKEAVLAAEAEEFFTMLTQRFTPLTSLQQGVVTAQQIRESMLIGNPLFIRVLAGVQYELIRNHSWTKSMVSEFFGKLAPHTYSRAHANSIWKLYAPEQTFNENALGPSGRRADSTQLVRTIAEWAIDRVPFVEEEPRPEPVMVEEVDEDEGIDYALGHSTKQIEREVAADIREVTEDATKRRSQGT